MSLYNETKFIMKKYNISANKSLGQNFLIDDEAVSTIVDTAKVTKDDLIIEIGPGLGTLTSKLLEKTGKVIAIELDKKMVLVLEDRFSLYDNFECINEDVLKVDLESLISEEKSKGLKTAKIVANLPYYITTPIIMKLSEEKLDIETITVMIQKEVADRLVAEPGKANTGAITYAINYYTNPKVVLQVPNTAFIPAPDVNSTVIQLEVLQKPKIDVIDEEMFFKVIKYAFMQRRKTLLNSLTNSKILGEKEYIEKMLSELGIEKTIRAENLSLEEFAKIANWIKTKS